MLERESGMVLVRVSLEAYILGRGYARPHLSQKLGRDRREVLICIEADLGFPALIISYLVNFFLGRWIGADHFDDIHPAHSALPSVRI